MTKGPGYLYILTNDSYPNLIKIGITSKKVEQRAKELYTTGVPNPFSIAYQAFIDEKEVAERVIHNSLYKYRENRNREFFSCTVEDAIKVFNSYLVTSQNNKYESIEILNQFKNRYEEHMNPRVSSIKITQAEQRVWVESTLDDNIGGGLLDQTILRRDLGMIADSDKKGLAFSPERPILENAKKYLDSMPAIHYMNSAMLFKKDSFDKLYKIEQELDKKKLESTSKNDL
ncbi:GIY-YIG nuclease family protein [Bacillus sp. LS15-K4]|nr:GIY-YIG nuclease family protein [Bacillus sp. LS15-K4]MDJ1478455.1 GIY-YIG nuclease family protein [Bacillus sp. LS15-K4]